MDYRFDTVAIVVSQHYRLLRSIVTTSATLRTPTPDEAQTADYLTDVLETVAGRKLAAYCRERFRQGWMTRDLRSYKIKFVLTKLRDMLTDGLAKEELKSRLADLTDQAEQLAGCTADGKRRNKKAREEHARQVAAKEEQRRLEEESRPQQMLLFAEDVGSSASPQANDIDDEALDDIDLLVVPIKSKHKTEESDDLPVVKSKKNAKKSQNDKKFEKLTKEILQAEYPDEEPDDPYVTTNEQTDDDLQDIEHSYGVYYGDRPCDWDDGTDAEDENDHDYEEETDV